MYKIIKNADTINNTLKEIIMSKNCKKAKNTKCCTSKAQSTEKDCK